MSLNVFSDYFFSSCWKQQPLISVFIIKKSQSLNNIKSISYFTYFLCFFPFFFFGVKVFCVLGGVNVFLIIPCTSSLERPQVDLIQVWKINGIITWDYSTTVWRSNWTKTCYYKLYNCSVLHLNQARQHRTHNVTLQMSLT